MFEKIDLTFSLSPLLFILCLVLLGTYAFYVYKYTIPKVNPAKKYFLVALRTLALLILLFVIFEPTLTLAKKIIIEPVNLIFVDNSRSINIEDGTNRKETVKEFLNQAESNNLFSNGSNLFSFGSKIEEVEPDSLNKINFTEGNSNFSQIFSKLQENNQNISSIIIVSDGVINEGSNPLYTAEKLNIPVFTIGIGDTTKVKDLEIKNVLYNEYIYAETPTTISASILNNGFQEKNVNVSLYENENLIEQKNIKLNDGIENISFTYMPKTGGEKKLTLSISNLDGEFTFANNKKIFYVNVLSNKIKILLVAGSPSPDLSFIKNALSKDENLTVNSITQIAQNKYLEKNIKENLIDSADVIFLIGFPVKETSSELLQKVSAAILNKSKPFFITLSNNVDFSKLNILQYILPFTVTGVSSNYFSVQPDISASQLKNPLLQNNSQNIIESWNNLPPVFQLNADYKAKPESEVISKTKINNVPVNQPLIITRKLGSERSIAVLAKNIWRWKLQTAEKNLNLFDSFILNSVKWLNTSSKQKQVSIKTSKKNYSLGENINFTAQVYDEAFNPASDAEVKVNISSGNENYELKLNSIGSGIYQGVLQTNKPGDYFFNGSAKIGEKNIGTDSGKFNIGEIDIEMLSPNMNYEFLNLLANQTNGRFFYNSDFSDLFSILKNLNQKSSNQKINVSEINLWSNVWLMSISILLFALEWYFRKKYGML